MPSTGYQRIKYCSQYARGKEDVIDCARFRAIKAIQIDMRVNVKTAMDSSKRPTVYGEEYLRLRYI